MLRKILKISVGLLLIFAVIVGIASIKHPIIFRWLTGAARIIGKPIRASVYTNGKLNPEIKVFYVDKYWNGEKADYYLLYFPTTHPTQETRNVMSIMRNYLIVGKPSSTNKSEYDIILGRLLQGEVGAKFTPYTDDMKGYNFDPHLVISDKQIKLNIPPEAKEFKCDSLRVEL